MVTEELDLENSPHEPCLYTWLKDGIMTVIVLIVDDMLIASNNKNELEEIKIKLKENFETKVSGEPENFLGLNIKRNRNKKVSIDQVEYTKKILERFKMEKNKGKFIMEIESRQIQTRKYQKLEENGVSKLPKTNAPYMEAIRSLLYLAAGTRPDISFAVNVLARRQKSLNIED